MSAHLMKRREFLTAMAVVAGRTATGAQRGPVGDPALGAELEKARTSADLEELLVRYPDQAQTIVPRIEAVGAAEVRRDGPGTRFVIGEIQPDEGAAASVTIDGSATTGITLKREFPGDVMSAAFTDGSVQRFTGTVPFATLLTLYGDGDRDHRLTFAVIAEYGMVYLRGKGRVVINAGGSPRTVTLGGR